VTHVYNTYVLWYAYVFPKTFYRIFVSKKNKYTIAYPTCGPVHKSVHKRLMYIQMYVQMYVHMYVHLYIEFSSDNYLMYFFQGHVILKKIKS
jgi:hypothetical protein